MVIIDPNHIPPSIFMFVYRRYGPNYSQFAGATLYNAILVNGICGIGGFAIIVYYKGEEVMTFRSYLDWCMGS